MRKSKRSMNHRPLRLESLEERTLMTVSTGLGFPIPDTAPALVAEGMIPVDLSEIDADFSPTPAVTSAENWGAVVAISPIDINNDQLVSGADLTLISKAWISRPGNPRWNPACDIDQDGVIGPGDMTIFSMNWLTRTSKLPDEWKVYEVIPENISFWGANPTYVSVFDEIITIDAEAGEQKAICPFTDFGDGYRFSAIVSSESGSNGVSFGLKTAVQFQDSGACYFVKIQESKVGLYAQDKYQNVTKLAEKDFTFRCDTFYSVWLQSDEGKLAFGVEDETLICVEVDHFIGGGIGVYAEKGIATFANFSVDPSPESVTVTDSLLPFDYGDEPVRYLDNGRICLGIDLSIGGSITYLTDTTNGGQNMINSADWGRQIQLSYYSGPIPYIGPNGEQPAEAWQGIGWNPIQSGDCWGYRSKVVDFQWIGDNQMWVKTIPMIWPNENVPAEAVFEVLYTLTDDGFSIDATIKNHRSDTTFYSARTQEMPAVYTNGSWYKLVSYLGDHPFEGEPVTVLVDKNDGNGWPWTKYYAPEHWSALVDDNNRGIGVYQPESSRMAGGFFGGDGLKGFGGPQDGQTGYIAPLATMYLDYNIEKTYQAIFILGTIEEIRDKVYQLAMEDLPSVPEWVFDGDRLNWTYDSRLTDTGFPIEDGLNLRFYGGGTMIGPETFWNAEDGVALEIDAEWTLSDSWLPVSVNQNLSIRITPVSPEDTVDWNESGEELAEKQNEYPKLADVSTSVPVRFDGVRRTYRVELSELSGYVGGMKQVTIAIPPLVAGEGIVHSIRIVRE